MRLHARAIGGMSSFLLLCLIVSPVAFAADAPKHPRQPRGLPNWSGLWESNIDIQHAELLKWPYNSEWQAKADAILATQDAHFYCTEGMPSTMQIPDTINMFEVLIEPKLTVMIFSNHEVRHIYTDGRPHPAADELWPTPEGDSIGHWDKDTLVIDTVSTRPQVMQLKPVEFDPGNVIPVSVQNTPTSDRLHIKERIRLLKGGILEDKISVEDPVAFTRPYQATFTFKRLTDLNRMVYEDCDENPRDFIKDGKAIMIERSSPEARK
jgi:hypothetical protein